MTKVSPVIDDLSMLSSRARELLSLDKYIHTFLN